MPALTRFLREQSVGDLISWQAQLEAAGRFSLSVRDVEKEILDMGLLPGRYQRNRQTLSVREQKQLFNSHVAVIGCGGLGGYVLEELARLGVGRITAVDFDVFEEHNLNRQLLATTENLGCSKADAAAKRIAHINPAVRVDAVKDVFSGENASRILEGCAVAVDALDSISVRRALAACCRELNIVMVHGAICGWYGQVATQYPGDRLVETLYASAKGDKGMELEYGNPSFTPAVVASLQVAETCKVLLGAGTPLQNRVLYVNLLDMELEALQP